MSSLCLSKLSHSNAPLSRYYLSCRLISRYRKGPKPLPKQSPYDHPLYFQCLQEFRESLGQPVNINQVKLLRERADYSFIDGRPTPLTPGQLQAVVRQKKLAACIVQQLKEIDFIEKRYAAKNENQAAERKYIIESKLKSKGKVHNQEERKEL